jgi:hypothetical protein
VGGDGQPRLLQPLHFARVGNRAVDFASDYLLPFLQHYAREIRSADPEAILFFETPPRQRLLYWDLEEVPNAVHAAHWYDGFTVFTKRFFPFLGADFDTDKLLLGKNRVFQSFVEQLARIKAESAEKMGGVPTLIGEFGIPFDLQSKRAYETGDFSRQVQAMDRSFRAIEANLLSGTLWNYTADNDNRWGDQWNNEDFSVFSRDQQTRPHDVNAGGRALEAVVRPYACKVAGKPLEMIFNLKSQTFDFAFQHDPTVTAPTEIYVPDFQYPDGYEVVISDGEYQADRSTQTLVYRHSTAQATHRIRVRQPRGR